GPHRGGSLLPRSNVRNDALLGPWLTQPPPFVRKKEECFVLDDWPAQHAAEGILPLRRLRQAIEVDEPVTRVPLIVAEVFTPRGMKGIGSRARHNRDWSSGRASELRGKRRRLDTKFLHGIHRHQAAGSARSTERG